MEIKSSMIDEINRYTNIDKDLLITRVIQSFLRETKRNVLLEKLKILSRYGSISKEELGGCPRIVFVARSSENFVDKAERAKSPEA